MIKEHCFTEAWIGAFKKQNAHKQIDKVILEKMIYALHLLEQIKINGLDFVFKGGTSLVLLLEEGNRFSIDIDIICSVDRKTLEEILNKVIETSKFKSYELDKHRSYKTGVPKAHYSFAFDSVANQKYSGTILLDVLIEDSLYPEKIETPIKTKWIETEGETFVNVPSIDSITGDKLTAFAPNTIGIPYFKGADKQPFAMEICKQLFDLNKLFEKIEDIKIVAASYLAFANQEIAYRKNKNQDKHLTPTDVLQDTFDTCLIITKRDVNTHEDKKKFDELQRGIRAFGTGFLMASNFRIDDAVPAVARIGYLVTKLLHNDMSPLLKYAGQDIKELNIEQPDWSFLNKLKRQADKSSFFYWHKTVELING